MATVTANSTSKKEFTKISSSSADDTITVLDGNFKIYAGKGNDTITLGSGESYVYAQDGNNTITAGSGNDYLYAGKGNDNFVFNSDFGSDVIYNANANDTITLGDYFNNTNFDFYRVGSDLVITDNIHTTDNTLTVSKFFKNKSKIDNFVQNGVTEKISDKVFYYSGQGTVKGTNFNDAMTGSVKKDTLYGYKGNDFLLGGKSDDKIYSGSGENRIIVNNGDGHDILYVDKNATSNTLMFDTNDTISYSKSGKDLVVSAITGTTKADEANNVSVTIKNYFDKKGKSAINSDIYLQDINLTKSATNIIADLQTDGITINGKTNKSNTLQGSWSYNNTIIGGDKNDTIYAGDADNRIYGGKGNDKYYVTSTNIEGVTKIFDESGNDTYNVKSLDTSVYINDSAGKDTLKITDKIDYTMIFDVALETGSVVSDSLFVVDNANIKDMSYKLYTAGGVEIGNYFGSDGDFGEGRIEKITVGGKTAVTTEAHFDEIRSNVEAWLTNSASHYTSASEVFLNGDTADIQSLLAVYQGNPVSNQTV